MEVLTMKTTLDKITTDICIFIAGVMAGYAWAFIVYF